MTINPMVFLQLREQFESFKTRHPKLEPFFLDVMGKVDVDSVIEVSITTSNGQKIKTNIKVTPQDKQLFDSIKSGIKE